MSDIKLTKTTLYIIIAVLVTLALSSLAFTYYPKYKENREINDYKKAMFDSVLCQYKCPLTNQVVQNVTKLLPEQECLKTCAKDFNALNIDGAKFSNKDLENDDLIMAISNGVNVCKTAAANKTSLMLNNEYFFNCSSTFLESLQQNYTYLR